MKQVKINSVFALIIVLLIVFACTEKDNVSTEKLAHVYVDLLIAEEFHPGIPDSILFYQNKIFEENSLTRENYFKQIENLKIDKLKWNEFFGIAESYLEEIRKKHAET